MGIRLCYTSTRVWCPHARADFVDLSLASRCRLRVKLAVVPSWTCEVGRGGEVQLKRAPPPRCVFRFGPDVGCAVERARRGRPRRVARPNVVGRVRPPPPACTPLPRLHQTDRQAGRQTDRQTDRQTQTKLLFGTSIRTDKDSAGMPTPPLLDSARLLLSCVAAGPKSGVLSAPELGRSFRNSSNLAVNC